MITLTEFLARAKPPSTKANPACMKNTKAVHIPTQARLISSFIESPSEQLRAGHRSFPDVRQGTTLAGTKV